jgi:hypothetical protein
MAAGGLVLSATALSTIICFGYGKPATQAWVIDKDPAAIAAFRAGARQHVKARERRPAGQDADGSGND